MSICIIGHMESRYDNKSGRLMIKILLIGPSPPPIGGATVLFKQLLDYLVESRDVSCIYINTSRNSTNRLTNILSTIRIIFFMLLSVRHVDAVSFHSSIRGSYTLGLMLAYICKIFRKPWLFRGFGGNYPCWYSGADNIRKSVFRHSVLSANVILLETKESVEYFLPLTSNRVIWYPNSRDYSLCQKNTNIYKHERAKKFIFLGHIKETKGIKILIEASMRIDKDITIDAYGPLLEGIRESDFIGSNVNYRGALNPSDVNQILSEYDAMVFPTFYDGEGYPGVILEAYGVGLPVITTRWRTIPEIVDESCGILIEPKNVSQLVNAINELSLNTDLLNRLRGGVSVKREQFDSKYWAQYFVGCCKVV